MPSGRSPTAGLAVPTRNNQARATMTEANPNYYSQPTAPEPAQGQDNARPVPQPPAPTQYGTVEAILAAPDISEEDMFIPEWNCTIRIRSLTKAQQHAIRSEASRGQKNQEPNPERVEIGRA